MKGFKSAGVFAACGFLLSFISGFFSHTTFISILLKALIFGIFFGILGFAIGVIFDKFLADDSGGDFSSSNNAKISSTTANTTTGQVVDITIEDEDLDNGTSSNHFIINDNHQMLNDSDIAKTVESATNEESKESGFVPLNKFETIKNISGKEAVNPDSVIYRSEESDVKNNDGIDTLPDMNNFEFEGKNNTSNDSDVETDSEFVSSTSMKKNNDEPAEIKDAALMAKAISSILSDEDS